MRGAQCKGFLFAFSRYYSWTVKDNLKLILICICNWCREKSLGNTILFNTVMAVTLLSFQPYYI